MDATPNEKAWDGYGALMDDEDVERQIHAYEAQFQMTSDEFLALKKRGSFPDSFEAIDWAILLKYR